MLFFLFFLHLLYHPLLTPDHFNVMNFRPVLFFFSTKTFFSRFHFFAIRFMLFLLYLASQHHASRTFCLVVVVAVLYMCLMKNQFRVKKKKERTFHLHSSTHFATSLLLPVICVVKTVFYLFHFPKTFRIYFFFVTQIFSFSFRIFFVLLFYKFSHSLRVLVFV